MLDTIKLELIRIDLHWPLPSRMASLSCLAWVAWLGISHYLTWRLHLPYLSCSSHCRI